MVDAFRPSAGEPGSVPLTGTSDEIVRAPAVGLGIEIGRRAMRVGPRWMLIVGGGCEEDDEEIEGTRE